MLTKPDPILRRPSVEKLTGLSCATLYRSMSRGSFPKPVKISFNAVGWRESDVTRWIESRETA